mmetsp:Transcript_63576/g.132359  ORF Transcript_63576/g.132359 Transcript_63576/m.132359 type:complete len:205 (+) Transcript_63576:607-1221(+)
MVFHLKRLPVLLQLWVVWMHPKVLKLLREVVEGDCTLSRRQKQMINHIRKVPIEHIRDQLHWSPRDIDFGCIRGRLVWHVQHAAFRNASVSAHFRCLVLHSSVFLRHLVAPGGDGLQQAGADLDEGAKGDKEWLEEQELHAHGGDGGDAPSKLRDAHEGCAEHCRNDDGDAKEQKRKGVCDVGEVVREEVGCLGRLLVFLPPQA